MVGLHSLRFVRVPGLSFGLASTLAVSLSVPALAEPTAPVQIAGGTNTERGRQRLIDGAPAEALLWLERAYSQGESDPLLPILTGEAMRALSTNRAVLSGHTAAVLDAEFDPAGKRVVTASADGTARLYDVTSGKLLAVLGPHPDSVVSAAFGADGKSIVTQCADKKQRTFDAVTFRLLRTAPTAPAALKKPVDPYTAKERADELAYDLKRAASRHGGPVRALLRSPDRALFLTTSDDKTAKLWSGIPGQAGTGQLTTLYGHGDAVLSGRFNHDASLVVTTSADRTARIFVTRVEPAQTRVTSWVGYSLVRWSQGSQSLAMLMSNKAAARWDLRSGTQYTTYTTGRDYDLEVALGPDDTFVLVPDAEHSEDQAPALLRQLGRSGDGIALQAVTPWSLSTPLFGPGGRHLFIQSESAVFSTANGRKVLQREELGKSAIAAFNFDDTLFLFGDSAPVIHSLGDGRPLYGDRPIALTPRPQPLRGAAFSPVDSRLLTYDSAGRVQIWAGRTGALLHTLSGQIGEVKHAAWSPGGDLIVLVGTDRTAQIFSAADGQRRQVLSGHPPAISHADISPDGRRVVTSSEDGSARVWDVASGKLLAVLPDHGVKLRMASWSPDGQRLFTFCEQGAVVVWEQAPFSGTKGSLADFVSCHLTQKLDGDRVVPAATDAAACERLPKPAR